MAALPYARARTLITGEGGVLTPRTLSKRHDGIYSYEKRIAWFENHEWYVVTRDSTPTTNRHIHAVQTMLEGLLVHTILVDYDTGQPV